tara:strand:- start:164 stop:364 length:201 start_codon:yes stop_codon:yes gene_type:complete
MSELKHKSDDELVEIIQAQHKYRVKLKGRKKILEYQVKDLMTKISNSEIKTHWAIQYLSGPYMEGE